MKTMRVFFRSVWDFLRRIWSDRQGRIGLIIVSLLMLTAIFASVIAPYDPYDVAMRDAKGLAPSLRHLLGTTISTGQDVFSMLIYGTRVSLSVGIITGLSIALLGSALGVAAGYLGGAADMILMRVVDVMIVIPTLPLTILITNVFGKSYLVIVLVFVLFRLCEGGGAFRCFEALYHVPPYPSRCFASRRDEYSAHLRRHHDRGGRSQLSGAGKPNCHQLGQDAGGRTERRLAAVRTVVDRYRARDRHFSLCVFLYARGACGGEYSQSAAERAERGKKAVEAYEPPLSRRSACLYGG